MIIEVILLNMNHNDLRLICFVYLIWRMSNSENSECHRKNEKIKAAMMIAKYL
jgi:hypothetical protein